MFISCPNCTTRYNVSAAQLGATGKSVKCTNCGNTWHQLPVADQPQPARPRGVAPQQPAPQQPQQAYPYAAPPGYPPPGYPPYPYPPQGYPPPGYPPPGYPVPGQAAAEQPAAPAPAPQPAPVQPEPEPGPEEEEITLPDMEEDIEDDPMAAFATDDDDDDDDSLSSDDIDKMFGDDDEPAALSSMVEDSDGDDDDVEDITGFDDLDEPEPIPQVFTADETGDDEFDDEFDDEEEDHSKGSVLKIILAVVLGIFILTLGGAIFLREMIIEMIPATEGIYSMVGLGDDTLGAGLSINDVKSSRESIGGKDVLVVRGLIVNVSKRERPVPMLELRLSDLDGKLVQSEQTSPLKKRLTVGDKIGFKIQVENPSALARKLEVTFIEEGGGAHGAAPKAEHGGEEPKKAH